MKLSEFLDSIMEAHNRVADENAKAELKSLYISGHSVDKVDIDSEFDLMRNLGRMFDEPTLIIMEDKR